MSDCIACKTLVNKTGDLVSLGLQNDHTLRGTVVGVFGDVLVLNNVTITVGAVNVTVAFYWVDCREVAWFN